MSAWFRSFWSTQKQAKTAEEYREAAVKQYRAAAMEAAQQMQDTIRRVAYALADQAARGDFRACAAIADAIVNASRHMQHAMAAGYDGDVDAMLAATAKAADAIFYAGDALPATEAGARAQRHIDAAGARVDEARARQKRAARLGAI